MVASIQPRRATAAYRTTEYVSYYNTLFAMATRILHFATGTLTLPSTGLIEQWRGVSCKGTSTHLITNEHCITSAERALNTDYQLMREIHVVSTLEATVAILLDALFIQDSVALDCCLVQIDSQHMGIWSSTTVALSLERRSIVLRIPVATPKKSGSLVPIHRMLGYAKCFQHRSLYALGVPAVAM
eukprot:scaffold3189_cov166-Amphora_coffeaeformis.AAC.4